MDALTKDQIPDHTIYRVSIKFCDKASSSTVTYHTKYSRTASATLVCYISSTHVLS